MPKSYVTKAGIS